MLASTARMKILSLGSVKLVDPFVHVFHGVRVYNIHNHGDTQSVCFANQVFQIFRSPETRRRRKEIGDMIPEGAVIRMLGNGHELKGRIAVAFDSRQNVVCKLPVCAHSLTFLGHSHMAFVNQQRFHILHVKAVFFPVKGRRKPQLPSKILGNLILNHTADIRWNPLSGAISSMHQDFHPASMDKCMPVGFFIKKNIPDPFFASPERMRDPVPIVKIANEEQGMGMGGPFAVCPAFTCFIIVYA